MPITVRLVRVPSWMQKGIDINPFINNALSRITGEMIARHDASGGLGARMNPLTIEVQPLLQTIVSPLADPNTPIAVNPRRTGASFVKKNTGRFKGMAPGVIKKYILEPLQALWRS